VNNQWTDYNNKRLFFQYLSIYSPFTVSSKQSIHSTTGTEQRTFPNLANNERSVIYGVSASGSYQPEAEPPYIPTTNIRCSLGSFRFDVRFPLIHQLNDIGHL